MGDNLKKYMHLKNVNATDVCKALHISHSTYSDWVNGKSYPRIDKIEMLANYFGVSKADLVEENLWQRLQVIEDVSHSMSNFGLLPTTTDKKEMLYKRFLLASPEKQDIIKRLLDLKEGDL
ncbi:MAG: helix-turn-helix domain-containing protein [Bacteroidales bacterium]|nr:helix-turn-helix domain-containing protein [Bacteroidales bacterium]